MRRSVATLAAGGVLALAPALLAPAPALASATEPMSAALPPTSAYLPASAGVPATPAPSVCSGLSGTAAAFFDQSALCRRLSHDLLTGRPDFGTALRDSMRGMTPPRRPHRSDARRRVFSHPPAPAPAPVRPPKRAPKPHSGPPASGSGTVAPGSPPLAITQPSITPSPTTPAAAPPAKPRPSTGVRALPQDDETHSSGPMTAVLAALAMLGVFLVHRRVRPVLATAVRSPLRATRRDAPSGAERVAACTATSDATAVLDRPTPSVKVVPPRPKPGIPSPVAAVQWASDLARPSGVGLVGDGADGFVRAVVTELVTRGDPRARVVLSRTELDRLFDGAFDEPLRSALEPELRVCELLEDAIEHLELEMLVSDAEHANPDLSPTRGLTVPTTYWIATPGHDDDVVLPLVRRGPAHRPVGVMFGVWPHGRTCSIDADGTLTTPTGPRHVPLLTVDESLAALRAHASTERTGWI